MEVKWLYTDKHNAAYRGGFAEIQKYNQKHQERAKKYPAQNHNYPDIIYNLERHGFYIWRQAIPKETILKLRAEAERFFNEHRDLKLDTKSFQMIDNPLTRCPTAFELAFSDLTMDIGTAFFGCRPAIGTVNLRRSLLSDEPPSSTSLWHSDDGNSLNFFKMFYYLNDVDEIGHGPFTIIPSSVNKKFVGWTDKYRYSEKEMKMIYGENSFKYLTAKAGDLIIARTTAFHRGTKPVTKERMMFTVNAIVHQELNGGRAVIRKEDYESLPDEKKAFADFCDKI